MRRADEKVDQTFTLDSLLGESLLPSLCFRGFRILVEGMCHLASVEPQEKTHRLYIKDGHDDGTGTTTTQSLSFDSGIRAATSTLVQTINNCKILQGSEAQTSLYASTIYQICGHEVRFSDSN